MINIHPTYTLLAIETPLLCKNPLMDFELEIFHNETGPFLLWTDTKYVLIACNYYSIFLQHSKE